MSEITWWINFEDLVQIDDFAVYAVCKSLKLPIPDENKQTDRLQFVRACQKLSDRQFTALLSGLSMIDAVLARKVIEDVIETFLVLFDEECEVQEQEERNLSLEN